MVIFRLTSNVDIRESFHELTVIMGKFSRPTE